MCATAIYTDPALGFTDRADGAYLAPYEGPKPGFLALTSWTMTAADAYVASRTRARQRVGTKDSLQACEKGLAPGSAVLGGDCGENNEKPGALVADLFLPAEARVVTPSSGLPNTAGAPGVALLLGGLATAITLRRRRRLT
jgi:hypothetical protein